MGLSIGCCVASLVTGAKAWELPSLGGFSIVPLVSELQSLELKGV